MKYLHLFGVMLVLFGAMMIAEAATADGLLEAEGLTPDSTFEFDPATQTSTATHGAIVKYTDTKGNQVTLTATQITFNQATGETTADGAVSLRREGQLWTGQHLEYNFFTKVMKAVDFRTGVTPYFASGMGLNLNQTNQLYLATNAVVTTDDVADPGFKIRAKTLKLIPGKSLEARDAVLYLGNVPVMYYPYYKRSLERHPNNWVLTPGYRSVYGPYLLTRYNWYLNERLSGAINLDYRQSRGAGGGPDFKYDLGQFGQGAAQLYYTRDDKPDVDPTGKPIREDRQRISFTHQATLRTNLTAKVVVREQSDAYFIRDFFETEYRKNIEPSSFLEVNQLWPNFSLNALAQPQINTFFETVERLPDIKLTAIRQQLGVSPFYYEGENSAGYFRYKYADNRLPDYAAVRADSFHQIVLPKIFFGWLNVTPRVGGRFTYYGEEDTRQTATAEQNRWVLNTGAEVSTKLSRLWRGAQSRFWDADGIRHILEPSVNYVFVPSPNKLPSQLPQFDSEMPTFRLPPIDYPDYNTIDSIDSQNVLRLGLNNKLQTKRKENIDNLVQWALYTDWRIKPRSDQATFTDFYSDMQLKPRSWLTFTSEARYSLDIHNWREANHYITLQPGNQWSVSLGHRYLRDDLHLPPPYTYGNNLITSRIFYRVNENWGLRVGQHFEARDGTMEEQYYTIYRDLRSWTSAMTFRIRENRAGPTDFTVGLTLSLKAFPRFGMGTDSDTPSTLLENF